MCFLGGGGGGSNAPTSSPSYTPDNAYQAVKFEQTTAGQQPAAPVEEPNKPKPAPPKQVGSGLSIGGSGGRL